MRLQGRAARLPLLPPGRGALRREQARFPQADEDGCGGRGAQDVGVVCGYGEVLNVVVLAKMLSEDERAIIRSPEFQVRFWSRVQKQAGDGCWLWSACRVGGYGGVTVAERMLRAHRVAWEICNGPIPDDMLVLHNCDDRYAPGDTTSRRCVRPEHLWLGTQEQNFLDMLAKRRHATGDRTGFRVHPSSRPVGERHGMHRLSEDQVLEIRARYRRYARNPSIASLAEEYGVSTTAIRSAARGKTWGYLS